MIFNSMALSALSHLAVLGKEVIFLKMTFLV